MKVYLKTKKMTDICKHQDFAFVETDDIFDVSDIFLIIQRMKVIRWAAHRVMVSGAQCAQKFF